MLECHDLFQIQVPSISNNRQLNGFLPSPVVQSSNVNHATNVIGNVLAENSTRILPSIPTNNSIVSLAAQLKTSLGFAQVIQGIDNRVNQDRLFIIFGSCWEKNFDLNVTRAVIVSF